MKATFRRDRLVPAPNGAVVSLGMFDGVHLGHQAILKANVARASALGAESTVVTFRRHPKHLLLGRAPKTLTTLEHRLELFARAGVQHAVALPFDAALRALGAAQFAQEIAVRGLGVRSFVLGFDSKFGHDRGGSAESLVRQGFDVVVAEKVVVLGRPVSSTAIREAVELGDLTAAAAMLGRPVSVFGRVVHGANLGRRIGFPTANLNLRQELHPPLGVYAVHVNRSLPGGTLESLPGVANIGFRPTVAAEPPRRPQVEVHLLDFEGDLYGEPIELEFVARLRGEKRFAGLDELAAQIARDVREARDTLGARPG
ncbi:MAG: riboflavin biosynthesis protein RibF [Planctomycetes bacterium]|nr:riboflavin biosynthesis protein RibF [Planctomycetota bacterium]